MVLVGPKAEVKTKNHRQVGNLDQVVSPHDRVKVYWPNRKRYFYGEVLETDHPHNFRTMRKYTLGLLVLNLKSGMDQKINFMFFRTAVITIRRESSIQLKLLQTKNTK